MPEKVRRIRKPLSSSTKKRIFFYGGGVLVFIFLSIVAFSFLSTRGPKTVLGIQNKETAAITCFATDCFLVNLDGVVVSTTARPSGSLFFLIDNKEPRPELVMGEQAIPQDTLAEVLFLRKKIQEDLKINLGTAFSNNFADFDVETSEGWVLRFSVDNNAPATIEVLRRVLDEIGSQRFSLKYIDLRLPTKVYYK